MTEQNDLEAARRAGAHGMTVDALTRAMQLDALQLAPVLETLQALDWIGQLQEGSDDTPARYLLLADPDTTPLAPLVQGMLLPHSEAVSGVWEQARIRSLWLRDAMPRIT